MTAAPSPTIPPVRHSVTVRASPERAFRVFTRDIGRWWPRDHHVGSSPLRSAVIEPRQEGRFYEIGEDGSECEWGRVLAWEPPRRLVLAWQLQLDWKFHPDLARASEVEVRFVALPDGSTRVDLEHRCFERHGPGAEALPAVVGGESGWVGILRSYAAQAAADPAVQAEAGPAA